MTDYISREAAQKVLCDACGNAACPRELIPRCSFYEKMQSIPAADVRPVRWIPVSERLPDMNDYDWVLGVVSGKFGYTVFQNAVICVGYDPDYGFFLEEYPDVEITVTHWMPLPEAPKED